MCTLLAVVCGYWGCNLRTLVNVYTIEKQRCRDRVINDFLSWSRHLLVPLLFQEVTSLHPPSFQRNDFSTCYYTGHRRRQFGPSLTLHFFHLFIFPLVPHTFYLGQRPNKNGM